MRVKTLLAGGVMAAAIIFSLEIAFETRTEADPQASAEAAGRTAARTVALAASPVSAGAVTQARVPRADDTHYWADVTINGAPVKALVDTGATLVALTRTDARRAGLRLDALTYDHPIETAGGVVNAARVRLARVAVGAIELTDVEGIVAPQGLGYSLLGMSYLGRLSRLEVTPEAVTLRR